MKSKSAANWFEDHRLISHAAVAVVSGVFVWAVLASNIAGPGLLSRSGNLPEATEGVSGHGSPGTRYSDVGEAERRIRSAANSADKQGATGVLKINSDGSLVVPPNLLSRFSLYPLNPDLTPNMEELALLGISKESGQKLQDLIRNLGVETIGKESKNYSILSQDDNQATLKIGANPAQAANQEEQINKNIQEIAGSRSELLQTSLYETLSHMTAGFGAHDKIVHMVQQEDGSAVYEIMELLPESTQTLTDHKAPINDYRKVALQIITFKSDGVPDRLKHLFMAN